MNETATKDLIALTNLYSAPNYSPLDVVLTRGKGAWVWDVEDKKYLDMHSAYSAMNFGHCNERITKRAIEQLGKLTLTSRAFYTEELALLSKELVELCKMESCLFMNSGAEAVETAVKCARKWGYNVKGITENSAEIICLAGNFHGRTTTIISFSDSDSSRKDFGPYTPGFKVVPFGDIDAIEAALTNNTVGILFEPIQGEGGIILPPNGYIKKIRELCTKKNILMIADEIQTGLCRTGKLFACDHENVVPDLYIVGKSLGGGIIPISAVIGKRELLNVFSAGTHGSTFGGNPFACAVAREVIALIKEEKPEKNSEALGEYLLNQLRELKSSKVLEMRGRGLFVGIEFNHEAGKAKEFSAKLLKQGVLCKDTRVYTIRVAPPLTISKSELDFGLEQLKKVLT